MGTASTETPTDVLVQTLRAYFNTNAGRVPEILAVYLFGSFARNTAREGSDIDVAFLFDRSFYKSNPYEAFAIAQMMCADASKAVSRTVDAALLNGASLFFAHEIISTGRCLYEKDPEQRIRYEIALMGQYFDFMPFLRRLRQNKMARMCASAKKHVER